MNTVGCRMPGRTDSKDERIGWSTLLKGALIAAVVGASLIAAVKGHATEPGVTDSSQATAADLTAIPHVNVRIRVIHAKSGSKHFDTHLDDIKRYLEKYRYSSYRLVIDDTMHLDLAGTQGIGLLSGKSLSATLTAVTPEKATIRLVLNGQAGQMLDTSISTGPNQLFFIAGPRYDDGVLFLAIEPQYDPKAIMQAPPVSLHDDGKRHE